MLGSAFLISPNLFIFYPATHFLWCLACFCFRTSCHMEASIQGQTAVPPHANSLGFFFCALLACQQKWAGMDGFALKVRERVIERGKRATDVQGYSLIGLIWLLFHSVTPFICPPSSAHYTSVYQVPSVSGLRWGCLLLLKHLLYKLNESCGLYEEEYSLSREGILIYFFYY